MSETGSIERMHSTNEQIAVWRQQANSIPGLLGGKSIWVPLVLELVNVIGKSSIVDFDSSPQIPEGIFKLEPSPGGASPSRTPGTWRQYFIFLRGVGLVESRPEGIVLSESGRALLADPRPEILGRILADKVRLFAETLSIVATEPQPVEGVHERVQAQYRPSWKSIGNTRSRLDWQEKLGLISPKENRLWEVTEAGKDLLQGRTLVFPEAFEVSDDVPVLLAAAPPEISILLDELRDFVREQESRNTYNIWVPSPPTSPNKVENLRTIINVALTRIERSELLAFISERFDLRRSSVDSMLPFLRASGLIIEVGRGVYEATPPARAWIESGDDINFVRILHAHMRFVGEMIREVEPDVKRSEMYAAGRAYGLNVDKCRWIASFLLNTGLIEEPRYGSLRATVAGNVLAHELPLAELPQGDQTDAKPTTNETPQLPQLPQVAAESPRAQLERLAVDPRANGTKPGSAFEYAVRDAFRAMGFDARVISGSGDTDVLVQWQENDGVRVSAVVEAKARSNGHVSHTDVSDVALETHKGRNNSEFVAVVGPAFSGDTIRNMAQQRSWTLIEAERLGSLVESVVSLGLRPYEAALLFRSSKGLSELEDLIADRARELDIVSFIFSKLSEELEEGGEAISARDISRDGRKAELAPSVTEVAAAIDLVSRLDFHSLKQIDASEKPEYVTYVLGDVGASVRRLRALADAMERRTIE